METFSALLAICAGNSPVPGEFLAQRPVTRNFDVFFDLHLNKRLSKQSWGWWFETLSCPFWRHCNVDRHCQTTAETRRKLLTKGIRDFLYKESRYIDHGRNISNWRYLEFEQEISLIVIEYISNHYWKYHQNILSSIISIWEYLEISLISSHNILRVECWGISSNVLLRIASNISR